MCDAYVFGDAFDSNSIGNCNRCSVGSDDCGDVQADWEDRAIEDA